MPKKRRRALRVPEGAACEPVKRTKAVPRRTTARRKIKGSEFVFKGKEAGTRQRFPLPDKYHAKRALVGLLRIAGRHGTGAPYKAEAKKVLRAVKRKFPNVYACELNTVAKIVKKYDL